jgi:hypothetical protein
MVAKLLEWFLSTNMKSIICLSSAHAFKRRDAQIQRGNQMYYSVSGSDSDFFDNLCSQLNWQHLEKEQDMYLSDNMQPISTNFQAQSAIENEFSELLSNDRVLEIKRMEQEREIKIPVAGHGITRHLFKQCISKGINILCLVALTFEGNNVEEGMQVAKGVHAFFKLRGDEQKESGTMDEQVKFRSPISWSAVFN